MIPEHPLLAIYVLGVYGFFMVPLFIWAVARERFEALIERSKEPRWLFLLKVLVAYSVGWPILIGAVIYYVLKGKL